MQLQTQCLVLKATPGINYVLFVSLEVLQIRCQTPEMRFTKNMPRNAIFKRKIFQRNFNS